MTPYIDRINYSSHKEVHDFCFINLGQISRIINLTLYSNNLIIYYPKLYYSNICSAVYYSNILNQNTHTFWFNILMPKSLTKYKIQIIIIIQYLS